ncbi:MAG: hypothetical protein LBU37_13390 [Tannerellaceae bacterium]|jgi:hypothetical protein|nr:hypothetical protein [Tannerellaceae bacterium]
MNELAGIVSESLSGELKKVICMGGKFYTVSAPATCVLARMLKPLSEINLKEGDRYIDMIARSVEQSKYIDSAIAYAVIGDTGAGVVRRFRHRELCRAFSHATDAERGLAFIETISLVTGKSFFKSARLAMDITKTMAKQKSSEETR